MSDSIEDIKFPSNFLAAIDSIHAEATDHFNDIGREARALVKERSSKSEKEAKDVASTSIGSNGNNGSNNSKGSSRSTPKM